MIYYWIKYMNNLNLPVGSDNILLFIQRINTLNNIIIKNGMKEIDIFMIIFMHHIFHKIKQRMLTVEYGQLISSKLDSDQEELTIFIIL
jgi:hypothetical protein